jgi:hypothetical protein
MQDILRRLNKKVKRAYRLQFYKYTQIKIFVLGITLTELSIKKYQIKITTSEIKLKRNIQEIYIP